MAQTLVFSSLPTGPLSTTVLYLTEGDLAQLLRSNSDMKTRANEAASDEFWRLRCCNTFGPHVDCVQGLGKEAFQAFLAAKAKRHLPDESGRSQSAVQPRHGGRLDRSRCSDQLFAKCLGASSQDMDDEKPGNTLVPSPCKLMLVGRSDWEGRLRQTQCGCVFASKCYWSSEPSPIAEKDEWLEYELADGIAVVSSFALTPYTSFWQPDQPTYNPVEACFQLTHPLLNGGEKPYYESPRFRVDGSMKRQQFDLPQPILSLGGRAKVVLLGMAQRQTLPESVGETANHYHICVSYASLMGTVLLSCRLADNATTRSLGDQGNGSTSSDSETGGGKGGGEHAGCFAATEGSVQGGEAQAVEHKTQDLRLQWLVEELESRMTLDAL